MKGICRAGLLVGKAFFCVLLFGGFNFAWGSDDLVKELDGIVCPLQEAVALSQENQKFVLLGIEEPEGNSIERLLKASSFLSGFIQDHFNYVGVCVSSGLESVQQVMTSCEIDLTVDLPVFVIITSNGEFWYPLLSISLAEIKNMNNDEVKCLAEKLCEECFLFDSKSLEELAGSISWDRS